MGFLHVLLAKSPPYDQGLGQRIETRIAKKPSIMAPKQSGKGASPHPFYADLLDEPEKRSFCPSPHGRFLPPLKAAACGQDSDLLRTFLAVA